MESLVPSDLRSLLTALAIAILVGFIIYRRVRRTVGRQPFKPVPLGMRAALLGTLCIVFLVLHPTTDSFIADAIGALVGLSLGFYAVRHAHFEQTDEGSFYTPNLYISLGVLSLLLARLGYRFASTGFGQAAAGGQPSPNPFVQMAASPLTTGLFFILASYYIYFNIGIIQRLRTPQLPTESKP